MIITRDFLSQYIYLESQINKMKQKIEYYRIHPLVVEHGVVKGSMGDFPYAECHFVVSAPKVKSEEERKKVISQLVIDLQGNNQLYEDMKLDIECFIESMTDLEMKEIFQLKYIERLTDEKIGEKLHYSRRAIGVKIDKFLRSTEQCHKCHL